jgi:hypothetical protein
MGAHMGCSLHESAMLYTERRTGLLIRLEIEHLQILDVRHGCKARHLVTHFLEIERSRRTRGRQLHERTPTLLTHQPAFAREMIDRLAHGDTRHIEQLTQLWLGRDLIAGFVRAVANPGSQRDVDLVVPRRRH